MSKQTINPPELFNSLQYGFSQIVISQGSKIVHISGQVAWDANGQIVGKGDLRTQAFEAFRNLESAMKLAGGTLADVATLRIYIVQSAMANQEPISEALKHFFPSDPPATNWIGVHSLSEEGFLIEIEAVAVMD